MSRPTSTECSRADCFAQSVGGCSILNDAQKYESQNYCPFYKTDICGMAASVIKRREENGKNSKREARV